MAQRHFSFTQILLFTFILLTGSALSGADYYWIGGSGDWSEISHWATTSGGITTHSQAPTTDDDVFFDANSFTAPGQVITLNTDILFCRSMRWTGVSNTPGLIGNGSVQLSIFGSLILSPDMVFDFSGSIRFTGAQTDNQIDFAGQATGAILEFSGEGAWSLDDEINTSNTISIRQGNLITNDQNITCSRLLSTSTLPRLLDLGTSTIVLQPVIGAASTSPVVLSLNATNLDFRGESSVFQIGGEKPTNTLLTGSGSLSFGQLLLNDSGGSSSIISQGINANAPAPDVSFSLIDVTHPVSFIGNLSVTSLGLSPGNEYVFGSSDTLVLGELLGIGDCVNRISLRSSDPAAPAFFQTGNAVQTDFIALQSINTIGTGSFTANNAIDQGNNDGWIINAKPSETLFWVGNTGQWHDPANWSFSSGGPASGCIPTAVDDVIFDINSFAAPTDTVSIESRDASCHTMNWIAPIGQPVLAGGAQRSIRLSGSLVLATNLQHNFAGDYTFSSADTGNTIQMAGNGFNKSIAFENVGSWRLTDSLFVRQTLSLNGGTLLTDGQTLNVNFLRSTVSAARTLSLADSRVRIGGRPGLTNTSTLQLLSTGLTLEADDASFIFAAVNTGRLILTGVQPLRFHRILFETSRGQVLNNFSTLLAVASVDTLKFSGNGEFRGNNAFGYCEFAPGYTFTLEDDRTQSFAQLIVEGSCDLGLTNIISASPDQPANVTLPPGQQFDRLHLRGIAVSNGAPVNLTNSVDERDNSGWNFDTPAGRRLFWVGGTGQWYDSAHWSLVSGGAGGECVPTIIDDITFDAGSGLGAGGRVFDRNSRPAYCQSLNWETGVSTAFNFNLGVLTVNGDLNGEVPIMFNTASLLFTGSGNHSIRSTGTAFISVSFQGEGEYLVEDRFQTRFIRHQTGNLRFRTPEVETSFYLADNSSSNKTLDLGSTHFLLTGEVSGRNNAFQVESQSALTIEPGTSLVELSGSTVSISINIPIDLNNILFSNTTGTGQVLATSFNDQQLTANQIIFNGNGNLIIPITTDSLLCTSGKSYRFSSGRQQTINEYWRILGNNCTPISLTSTAAGTSATVSMPPSGEVLANSVQMRDINAIGGAEFLAGILSTDIANSNDGWRFETAQRFIDVGFLGEDQGLCQEASLVLDANNFSVGESYLWQDGSADSTLTVTAPGIYAVEVTFLSNCTIQDSVLIIDENSFSVSLPADTMICEGDSLTFMPSSPFNGVDFVWQDGSRQASFTARQGGTYYVNAGLDGCLASDTLQLSIADLPDFSLGGDQTACEGETFTLDAPNLGGDIRWNDGDSLSRKDFTADVFATVEVTDAFGCTGRDSAMLTFDPLPLLDLGPDTTVCSDRPYVLSANLAGGQIFWPDGSGEAEFQVFDRGTYIATLEADGCVVRDTVSVNLKDCKDFQAYLPTAFSPDGDGVNDGYAPFFDEELRIMDYRLEIFSRWGEQVFVTEDPFERWDGKIAGRDAPFGVYIARATISYEDDRGQGSDVLAGDVMLLR